MILLNTAHGYCSPHRGLKFQITDQPRRDGAEGATDAVGMPTDGPDDLMSDLATLDLSL